MENNKIPIRGHDAIQLVIGIDMAGGTFDADHKELRSPLQDLSRKPPDSEVKLIIGPGRFCLKTCPEREKTCDPESPDLVDLDELAIEILHRRIGPVITIRRLTHLSRAEIAQIQQEYFQTPGDTE